MSATDWQAHRQNQRAIGQQPLQAWYGEVTEPPKDASSTCGVRIVHGAMSGYAAGQASWPKPAGKTLPSKGDKCLVVYDEGRQPWIVAWSIPNWGH